MVPDHPLFFVVYLEVIPMSLMFTDPDEGWQLECDNCYEMLWSQRWLDAGSLVLEAEGEGWELEVTRWDGVTYADAKCEECKEGDEDE